MKICTYVQLHCTTDLHKDVDGGNPAESTGIQQVGTVMLWGYSANGNECSRIPVGMEQNCAGFPQERSSI